MNVNTLFMKKIQAILLLKKTNLISEEEAKDQIDWAINAYELNDYAMALNSFTDEVSGQMEGFSEMETSKETNKRIIDFIKKFKELSHNLVQTELTFDEIREASEEWQ